MLIEPAEVPIIGGRGTEEDGWRQVVSSNLAEFIGFSGSTRLDGNTITWRGKREQRQRCCEGIQDHGQIPVGNLAERVTLLPGDLGALGKPSP